MRLCSIYPLRLLRAVLVQIFTGRILSVKFCICILFTSLTTTTSAHTNHKKLDVVFQHQWLGQGLNAYAKGEFLYLSLQDINQILGLSYKITDGGFSGRAVTYSDWMSLKHTPSTSNRNKQWLFTHEKDANTQPKPLFTLIDNQLYIEKQTLSHWLKLNIRTDLSRSLLLLEPQQNSLVGYHLKQRQTQEYTNKPIHQSRKAPSYSGFDFNRANLQIDRSTNLDKDDNRVNSTNYSVFATTDLAWMNADIALLGNRKDGLSHSHIRFDRYFSTNNANSRYLSHIAIGDLGLQGLALTHQNRGRGLLLSNEPASKTSIVNKNSIEGSALPGWRVDLYANGLLLNTQTIGEDGRYQFDNLDLFLGNNAFLLKWTGPDGQEYSEPRNIYKGNDFTKAGDMSYQLSIMQPNLSLLSSTDPSPNPQNSNSQVHLHWDYNLTNNISFDMGVQHTDINDKSNNNVQAGLQTKLKKVQLSVSANKPNNDKTRVQYQLGHQNGDTRLLFTRTDRFTPAEILDFTQNKSLIGETLYKFDIYSQLDMMPARFNMTRFKGDTLRYNNYQLYLSNAYHITPSSQLNWSNRLDYASFDTTNSLLTTKAQNSKGFTGHLKTTYLSNLFYSDLTLGYKIKPDTRLNHIQSSSYIKLTELNRAYFKANHQFKTNQSQYTLGVSWANKHLRITPEISYSSGNIKAGKITFNTSLYKDRKDLNYGLSQQHNIQPEKYHAL